MKIAFNLVIIVYGVSGCAQFYAAVSRWIPFGCLCVPFLIIAWDNFEPCFYFVNVSIPKHYEDVTRC